MSAIPVVLLQDGGQRQETPVSLAHAEANSNDQCPKLWLSAMHHYVNIVFTLAHTHARSQTHTYRARAQVGGKKKREREDNKLLF